MTARALVWLGLVGLMAATGCPHAPGMVAMGIVDVARCAPDSPLEGDTRFDETNADAIVVIGASQMSAITFASVVDDGANWRPDRKGSAVSAKVEEKFLVARLKPSHGKHRYAINRLSLQPEATDCYSFPQNAPLLVFDAPPGQVTYLGGWTVEYVPQGHGSAARLREDPAITREQAVAHMARRYPQIRSPLIARRTEWVHQREPD